MHAKKLFFVSVFCFFISIVSAQEKKDSIYYKIEEFSDKRKSTKFIHRLIFRREADSVSVKSRTEKQAADTYRGKIIRNIRIETTDPFGYQIADRKKDQKWYDRLADRIHIDSKKSTIHNYLLFKKGETYNAQKLYESERVLRNTNFVNRVKISVADSTSSKDSIDILVQVLDSWSLKPRLRFSGKKFGVGAKEENLLGLGHEVNFLYTDDFKDKQNNILAGYKATNLFGSFIDAEISGEKDFYDNERLTFSATRDFFSPLTRWAGGFTFEYFMRRVLMPLENTSDYPEVQIKVYNQDLWGGYQFPVFIGQNAEISRNIAVLGRFQNYQYKDSPLADENGYFSSNTSFLASAKFIERKYSVQKDIFQYNLPEDIPYGKSLGFTGGFLNRGTRAVPYAGISASLGTFINWGYFTAKAEYGRFFNENKANSDSFRFDGTYFTNLQNLSFGKVRHFISPTFAWGSQLYNTSYRDRINFVNDSEFPPYSEDYIGTKKLILRYQLQLYIDKTWKNFHFSPYSIVALGWMSQNSEKLFSTKTESKFGIGVLIDNPYLVFNRIQLSFVFYPKVPFDNKSVFEFNDYRNNMLPLNNFETSRPHFVNFPN
ncbi:POTRA domain-containing protein [Kaistella palustris]|uniref:POTRA domain-containing protein n=1 Tax=Kaistella palustris TaxID=493376 RepID=UPI0004160331|nr:POTRA domain-containing protein [Kaistella palustris]